MIASRKLRNGSLFFVFLALELTNLEMTNLEMTNLENIMCTVKECKISNGLQFISIALLEVLSNPPCPMEM